jgi:ankyrin repeat protein
MGFDLADVLMSKSATGIDRLLDLKLVTIDESVNDEGVTMLMFVCHKGNPTVAKALISRKANVNAVAKDGLTALHLAVAGQKTEMVELLLKEPKIDIELRTTTTSHHCWLLVLKGMLQFSNYLLKRGQNLLSQVLTNCLVSL